MDREQFKIFTDKILSRVADFTELYSLKKASGEFTMTWDGPDKNKYIGRQEIVEQMTSKIFVDENKIYPCVDIQIFDIDTNGDITIRIRIAGFEPRPFQNNWADKPGPYIFMILEKVINPKVNTKSEDFRKQIAKITEVQPSN